MRCATFRGGCGRRFISSYALFVSATVHAFAAGPDTRGQLFQLVSVAAIANVAFLTVVHMFGCRGRYGRRFRAGGRAPTRARPRPGCHDDERLRENTTDIPIIVAIVSNDAQIGTWYTSVSSILMPTNTSTAASPTFR